MCRIMVRAIYFFILAARQCLALLTSVLYNFVSLEITFGSTRQTQYLLKSNQFATLINSLIGIIAITATPIFCWHAIQLVFLPTRYHLRGRGWYTVVSMINVYALTFYIKREL